MKVTALSLGSYDAAMAWVLARRLAGPLTVVAGGVTRITDGALDTTIAPVGGSREVSELLCRHRTHDEPTA